MDAFINDPDITARSWHFALDRSVEETRKYLDQNKSHEIIWKEAV
jgi:hypothetical protein